MSVGIGGVAGLGSLISLTAASVVTNKAAMEEALRRMKPDVRPEHYAAFIASAVEGQDTETVMRLYRLSRDNLYQIRTRLTEKLREMMPQVLAEMDAPCAPGPRP